MAFDGLGEGLQRTDTPAAQGRSVA
jgi:hypothetical protein